MSESRCWTWRSAIAKSGMPTTMRCVLWAISFHMNEHGGGCYPSQETIAEETGLKRETVNRYLVRAMKDGWLEITQHGFAGRRWRRNEYVACWPEREMVGTVVEEEGSDPRSQPCDDEVVILTQDGSDPGSHGVVIQDHTNPPRNPPVNPPVERGRARADDSGLEEIEPTEPLTPKQIETAFKRTFHRWPSFVTDSEPEARKVWLRLSDDERRAAEDRLSDYVAAGDKLGRKKFCAFAVYLRETRWDRLAPKAPTVPDTHVSAKPHGKPWNAKRLAELLPGPCDIPQPGTAFLRQQLAADKQRQRLRLIEHGYPVVNEMTARGRQGHAYRVPAEFELISEQFQECAADDDNPLWNAWQDLHEARDWPQMDRPPSGFAWLPVPPDADGYTDMAAFVRDALAKFEADLADLGSNEGKSDDECAA